jgi:hypothetical protein
MSSDIEERMKAAKTTAKSFRFTPREWSMIEAEASRLNMSKAFFVQLAVTAAIGKFKPLPRFDYSDFLPEAVVKAEANKSILQMAQ